MFDRAMDFGLGEDIGALRDTVRRFAAEEIAPRAAEIDRTEQFPADLWPKLGELGLHGITVPEEMAERASAISRIRRGGGDFPRLRLGRPQLRRALESLRQPDPPLTARRSRRRSTCRSSSRASTSARSPCASPAPARTSSSMKLRAEKANDRYVLNGNKMWITNGPDADTLVVYAKTDPEAGPKRHHRLHHREGHGRASPPPRSSTSSGCAAPTPASSSSRTARCRSRTCSARRAAASGVLMSGLDYERVVLAGRAARHHGRVPRRGRALRPRAQAVRPGRSASSS